MLLCFVLCVCENAPLSKTGQGLKLFGLNITWRPKLSFFVTGTPPKSSKCQWVNKRFQTKLEYKDWYPPKI